MGFKLAEVVAELGEGVLVGSELESREDGFMDLPSGAPVEYTPASLARLV